jgi:Flp pilus assembly protein TadD
MLRVCVRALAFLLALGAAGGCAHFVVLHDALTANEHNDLGVVYQSHGQLALAAKEFKRSLRHAPRSSRARVNLGGVQAAMGDWRGAERSFRRALRDSSMDADAMNDLAVTLLHRRRRLGEARALAERAVAAGGRDSVYRATLAEVSEAMR